MSVAVGSGEARARHAWSLGYADAVALAERASSPEERLSDAYRSRDTAAPEVARRLEEWREIVARGDAERFARRLQWSGLDERSAARAVGPVRLNPASPLPEWVVDFTGLLEAAGSKRARNHDCGFIRPDAPLAFERVIAPLVAAAGEVLERSVGLTRLSDRARDDLSRWLLRRLSLVMAEALFIEFAAFRWTRLSTLDLLVLRGRNAVGTAVYEEFVDHMLADGLPDLIRRHPVLGRLVTTLCRNWCEAAGELVERIERDWDLLGTMLGAEAPPQLVASLDPLLSDAHHGGRCVVRVHVDSGARVIYKPRSVENETKWFELVNWLNDHGLEPPLRRLRVAERDGYGWVECVEPSPCADRAAAQRFYERAGALLAVTYALGTTDCHHENLIAAGEQPVIVDLETLVSHVHDPDSGAASRDVAEPFFFDSIIRSALAPRWLEAPGVGAVDVSALGAVGSQPSRVPAPVWADVNTDAMELRREHRVGVPGPNAPQLDGAYLSPEDFEPELARGFVRAYDILAARAEELLAEGGPVQALAEARVRVICRPTYAYYMVLERLRGVAALRDGADSAITKELMFEGLLDSPRPPPAWALVERELEALDQYDCPHFTAPTCSADIDTADGSLRGILAAPCIDTTAERLRGLGAPDREKQLGLLTAVLDARVLRGGHGVPDQATDTAPPLTPHQDRSAPEDLVEAACAVARELGDAAIRGPDGSVGWIALRYLPAVERYQLDPSGADLFAGRAGIAVFLVALARLTGQSEERELALATLLPLRAELQALQSSKLGVSAPFHGLTGFAGILYALAFLAEALEDETLLDGPARAVVELLADAPYGDHDVLSGAAGSILSLLRVEDAMGDGTSLAIASDLGEQLLARRVEGPKGARAWPTFEGKAIASFAHGTAGIAHALERLAAAAGSAHLRDAAREGIEAENALFDPTERNWIDLRWSDPTDPEPRFADGWCHGAPGIALSRLEHGSRYSDDVAAGVEVALRNDGSGCDHLCCGNAGRAAILFEVGLRLGRADLKAHATARLLASAARARARGRYLFPREYPSVLAFPGLFQGVSGIGYALLRCARPDIVPDLALLTSTYHNRKEA